MLMAKEVDKAWKEVCASNMMETSFANVGLSFKLDGSQDHMMKFQGQSRLKKDSPPQSEKICNDMRRRSSLREAQRRGNVD